MATIIDSLGILEHFSPIFASLLVFAVLFALLSQTRILGDNKIVQSLVSIILALLVLMYPDLVELINFIAPWFVILFFFLIMVLLVYRIFGISEQNITAFIMGDRTVNWVLLAISLIILLAGIFTVFGQRALDASGPGQNATAPADGFQGELFETLFHPKMLGLFLVFGIAVFAIAFLGGGGAVISGGGGGHGGH